ncbi:MAG: polyprenyl synthetase family protein [Candidatus Diapherotrites archaeon]|jgi:geranylgeranyl pyrophosphate synthase|nr:polyprenyl synthetase family protein [Candidatus Diapherotrites archaeon]
MILDQEVNLGIKEFLESKKAEVEKAIENYIPRKATKEWVESGLDKTVFELDLDAYTAGCNAPIWDLLDRGGKRFRPILTCITSEAVGGKWEDGLKLAPMVELIHNGTLMQDDVEDDSAARRGQPCTHHKFGVDTAVNTGTIMYFWPMVKIMNNEFGFDDKKKAKINDLFIKELLRVCSGQVWDIAWHHGGFTPNEKQYLNMCLSKTGVLTKFACQLGAIVGGTTDEQYIALGKFGQIVGVGFQIQDDILELTEDTFKEGKGSIGGDIHEGKRTLIVIRTMEVATDEDKNRLTEILDSHTEKEEEIKEALDIINKYDGIKYSKSVAEKMVTEAWVEVDQVLEENNAKKVLKKFAEYLVDRKI